MSERNDWQQINQRYLTLSMQRVRQRLAVSAGQDGDVEYSRELDVERSGLETLSVPPAAVLLAQRFGLSPFERDILMLCAAVEFDTSVPATCAVIHGNPHGNYPTFSLAMSIFEEPTWEVVAPEAPLRRWKLIHLGVPESLPMISRPLRGDERIVNYLKGLNHIDASLLPYLQELSSHLPLEAMPDSHRQLVDDLERAIRSRITFADRDPTLVVQLVGNDELGKRDVATAVARKLGLQPFELRPRMLPPNPLEIDNLARRWRREAMLMPVCLRVRAGDAVEELGGEQRCGQFIESAGSIVFADVDQPLPPGPQRMVCEVMKPNAREQSQLWKETLAGIASEQAVEQVAGQFCLSAADIHDIAARVGQQDESDCDGRLWRECRHVARPRIDNLAQRIDTKATWDDLVLPDLAGDQLRQICNHVRYRSKVYEEWGFGEQMNRGTGISVLFAGPSGTGKTMAAEVIANDLQLDLYRVDLSSVVNKYIGETEKNLRRVFDAADDGGVILFFDECDALFGKRTEVKDSHDRFANIEINYLLQRMENYRGLAILATNMKSSLDKAFLRRLRFIIDLPMPTARERKQIWQQAFPKQTPLGELDYSELARLKLSGANIKNVAIHAAFFASTQGASTTITEQAIAIAIETEYRRLQLPLHSGAK